MPFRIRMSPVFSRRGDISKPQYKPTDTNPDTQCQRIHQSRANREEFSPTRHFRTFFRPRVSIRFPIRSSLSLRSSVGCSGNKAQLSNHAANAALDGFTGNLISAENCTASSTVHVGSMTSSCGTIPMYRFEAAFIDPPFSVTSPLEGNFCPARICSSVVFPLPDSPMIAVTWPGVILPQIS